MKIFEESKFNTKNSPWSHRCPPDHLKQELENSQFSSSNSMHSAGDTKSQISAEKRRVTRSSHLPPPRRATTDDATTLEASKASGAVFIHAKGNYSVPENANFSGIATSKARRNCAPRHNENPSNRRATTCSDQPERAHASGLINGRYVRGQKPQNTNIRHVNRSRQRQRPDTRHRGPIQPPGKVLLHVQGNYSGPERFTALWIHDFLLSAALSPTPHEQRRCRDARCPWHGIPTL
jgi:hypothetical protein